MRNARRKIELFVVARLSNGRGEAGATERWQTKPSRANLEGPTDGIELESRA